MFRLDEVDDNTHKDEVVLLSIRLLGSCSVWECVVCFKGWCVFHVKEVPSLESKDLFLVFVSGDVSKSSAGAYAIVFFFFFFDHSSLWQCTFFFFLFFLRTARLLFFGGASPSGSDLFFFFIYRRSSLVTLVTCAVWDQHLAFQVFFFSSSRTLSTTVRCQWKKEGITSEKKRRWLTLNMFTFFLFFSSV